MNLALWALHFDYQCIYSFFETLISFKLASELISEHFIKAFQEGGGGGSVRGRGNAIIEQVPRDLLNYGASGHGLGPPVFN